MRTKLERSDARCTTMVKIERGSACLDGGNRRSQGLP
jgi:hypothetical protein